MTLWLLLSLAAVGVAALALGVRGWRRRQREARLRLVLDRADALQALLATASQRMAAWRGTVGQLAGDLGSGAQRALEGEPLIREAKRDLLQHRLWLQQNGLSASTSALDDAGAALARVHDRLAAELQALDSAGDALAQATDAAQEAARREPPSLRRGP